MTSTRAFLGRGLGFPVLPQPGTRSLQPATGAEKVRQSILLILETEPGERLMRPDFGCGLGSFLMKPNTTATRSLIARKVRQALETFEPRIALAGVRVDPGDDPALVLIEIDYALVRDGTAGNLVFPFYPE